ncbi:MAG: fibronectin type III domain-containing protein [Terriglobia bacterium]
MEQVGRTLTLSFTIPTRATDGRGLTKPVEAEIFRQVTSAGVAPLRSFVTAKPWLQFTAQEVSRFKRGPKLVYEDRISGPAFGAWVGKILSLTVVTLTRGFRGRPRESTPSNVARIMLLNVRFPVRNLTARQVPGALEVEWSAPAPSGSRLSLTGYRIYRSEKSGLFTEVAGTESPHYRDTDFQFGQSYRYKVRAVFAQDGYSAETGNSAVAEVAPRHIFPPPPPQGLTAVYTGKAVQLIWKPESAPDLAGYNVYRRERGEPARRLNPQLLPTPVFKDAEVRPDAQYEYWVTALDKEHNESQPSAPFTVATR